MDKINAILSNYECVKCKNTSAVVGDLSATGKGLSKMFDIQVNKFTTISCSMCGYTEFYKDNINGNMSGADWVDIFFGG